MGKLKKLFSRGSRGSKRSSKASSAADTQSGSYQVPQGHSPYPSQWYQGPQHQAYSGQPHPHSQASVWSGASDPYNQYPALYQHQPHVQNPYAPHPKIQYQYPDSHAHSYTGTADTADQQRPGSQPKKTSWLKRMTSWGRKSRKSSKSSEWQYQQQQQQQASPQYAASAAPPPPIWSQYNSQTGTHWSSRPDSPPPQLPELPRHEPFMDRNGDDQHQLIAEEEEATSPWQQDYATMMDRPHPRRGNGTQYAAWEREQARVTAASDGSTRQVLQQPVSPSHPASQYPTSVQSSTHFPDAYPHMHEQQEDQPGPGPQRQNDQGPARSVSTVGSEYGYTHVPAAELPPPSPMLRERPHSAPPPSTAQYTTVSSPPVAPLQYLAAPNHPQQQHNPAELSSSAPSSTAFPAPPALGSRCDDGSYASALPGLAASQPTFYHQQVRPEVANVESLTIPHHGAENASTTSNQAAAYSASLQAAQSPSVPPSGHLPALEIIYGPLGEPREMKVEAEALGAYISVQAAVPHAPQDFQQVSDHPQGPMQEHMQHPAHLPGHATPSQQYQQSSAGPSAIVAADAQQYRPASVSQVSGPDTELTASSATRPELSTVNLNILNAQSQAPEASVYRHTEAVPPSGSEGSMYAPLDASAARKSRDMYAQTPWASPQPAQPMMRADELTYAGSPSGSYPDSAAASTDALPDTKQRLYVEPDPRQHTSLQTLSSSVSHPIAPTGLVQVPDVSTVGPGYPNASNLQSVRIPPRTSSLDKTSYSHGTNLTLGPSFEQRAASDTCSTYSPVGPGATHTQPSASYSLQLHTQGPMQPPNLPAGHLQYAPGSLPAVRQSQVASLGTVLASPPVSKPPSDTSTAASSAGPYDLGSAYYTERTTPTTPRPITPSLAGASQTQSSKGMCGNQ